MVLGSTGKLVNLFRYDNSATFSDVPDGIWYINNPTTRGDQPASNWGILMSASEFSGTPFQLYFGDTDGTMFHRSYNTTDQVWGAWTKPAAGKASITTTSLGQSWYRVYSDGWIEQGGYAKSGGSTSTAFTFPKAFTTAIRTIHLEPNCTGGEYWNAEIRIVASSLTTFNVQSVQAHSVGSWAFNFYWYAAGY